MILFYSLDYIVFVVQGVANDYIKTIICKKTQYTTVNNTDVNPDRIFHRAPQASVLETPLFDFGKCLRQLCQMQHCLYFC